MRQDLGQQETGVKRKGDGLALSKCRINSAGTVCPSEIGGKVIVAVSEACVCVCVRAHAPVCVSIYVRAHRVES